MGRGRRDRDQTTKKAANRLEILRNSWETEETPGRNVYSKIFQRRSVCVCVCACVSVSLESRWSEGTPGGIYEHLLLGLPAPPQLCEAQMCSPMGWHPGGGHWTRKAGQRPTGGHHPWGGLGAPTPGREEKVRSLQEHVVPLPPNDQGGVTANRMSPGRRILQRKDQQTAQSEHTFGEHWQRPEAQAPNLINRRTNTRGKRVNRVNRGRC